MFDNRPWIEQHSHWCIAFACSTQFLKPNYLSDDMSICRCWYNTHHPQKAHGESRKWLNVNRIFTQRVRTCRSGNFLFLVPDNFQQNGHGVKTFIWTVPICTHIEKHITKSVPHATMRMVCTPQISNQNSWTWMNLQSLCAFIQTPHCVFFILIFFISFTSLPSSLLCVGVHFHRKFP